MKFGHILRLAIVAAAGLLLGGSESGATSISLPTTADQLTSNSITFGPPSTTFSFVSVNASGTAPPTLSGITVNPLSPVGTSTNLTAGPPFGFDLTGSVVSANTGQTSELILTYMVQTTGPVFTSLNLYVDGTTSGGTMSVTETLTNLNGGGSEGSFSTNSFDMPINYPIPVATSGLVIIKDIKVVGKATVIEVRDTVAATQAVSLPEPASVVMLVCGLAGVLGLSLCRRKKTAWPVKS